MTDSLLMRLIGSCLPTKVPRPRLYIGKVFVAWMTAQVAVLNLDAIALASDSAITLSQTGGEKIFKSANKLFPLSLHNPVGIMVHGNAVFMDVPWETIIKIYRDRLGNQEFDDLKGYSDDFIRFLDNGNPLFPDSTQDNYVETSIQSYFEGIREDMLKKVNLEIEEKAEISHEDVVRVVGDVIQEHFEVWEEAVRIPSIPDDHESKLTEKHGLTIIDVMKTVLEKLPVSEDQVMQLKTVAVRQFTRMQEETSVEDFSGIVIAGFGKENTFPSLVLNHLNGIANDRLVWDERLHAQIDPDRDASIIPFAQIDMVQTFMEGVDPFYLDIEVGYLLEMLGGYVDILADMLDKYTDAERDEIKEKMWEIGGEVFEDFIEDLEEYRKDVYAGSILDVVSMLPKDELASMAESLVSLTSFKRRVSMESETVAGPVDVAVISKGDGFMWIKRKLYFNPELNPKFFDGRYGGIS